MIYFSSLASSLLNIGIVIDIDGSKTFLLGLLGSSLGDSLSRYWFNSLVFHPCSNAVLVLVELGR